MARIQIVHNPASGSFDSARFSGLVAAFAALGHDPISSVSSPAHPFLLEAGVDHVCVAGGDGTVRHVVAALQGKTPAPTISIYPMGTINLVAREIGWPANPKDFVARVDLSSNAPRVWPVAINQDWFVACASIGPDSRAVAAVSLALKNRIGRLAYGVALIKMLFRWQRPQIRVEADGQAFDCEAVYIAKGRFFAGPWSFAPSARLDQPDLHLVALPNASRTRFVHFLLRMITGRIGQWSGAVCIAARSVTISSASPQAVQIDGDIGCMTPVSLRVADHPLCG